MQKCDMFPHVKRQMKGSVFYYPTFLKVAGKKCVVVGGGKVAFRKVTALLECGAHITVVSPVIGPGLRRLRTQRTIRLVEKKFSPKYLKEAAIVFAATDQKETNRKIADVAKKYGAFVNVVDDPEESDFIVPSFLRRGDLTIAISTGGGSPALARKIRTALERHFGKEYASLLSLIAEVRSELKRQGIVVRPKAWQEAIDLDLLSELLRSRERRKAKALLLKNLGIKSMMSAF